MRRWTSPPAGRRSSNSPAAFRAGPNSPGYRASRRPGPPRRPVTRWCRSVPAVSGWWPARPRRLRRRRQRCDPAATTLAGFAATAAAAAGGVRGGTHRPTDDPTVASAAWGRRSARRSLVGHRWRGAGDRPGPPDVPHLQRHRVRHGCRFGARHTPRRSQAPSPAERRVGPRRGAIRRRGCRSADRRSRLPARHGADDRRRPCCRPWSVE